MLPQLEVPKMPKIEEFCHFKKDGARALRERNHNFRHFRSF